MNGSTGLLEKLARLGIHMIPQVSAAAGGAMGGPAGAAIGQIAGTGLESLLQPQQSPYEGGLPVGPGMQMMMPQEQDRLGNVMKSMAGQGLSQGMQMGGGAPAGMPSDDWIGLMQKVIQTVPRDELMRWLEQRNKSQVEGAM